MPAPAANLAAGPITSQGGPGQHARAQGSKPGDEANDAEGGAAQMLWRHRRDERREHPLCEAHLQSPQANADKENNERLSETDQEIGRDQATRPRIRSGRAPILSCRRPAG
jgi:hypothetical protein